MHGTTRTRTLTAARPARTGRNAVVWIGRGRAVVIRDAEGGGLYEAEVALPEAHAATPLALAEVAHRIGSVDRVLVLGPDDLRTALEREIVAIGHAPDTIRESTLDGAVDRAALIARLRGLG
jgi:hypothetical protein